VISLRDPAPTSLACSLDDDASDLGSASQLELRLELSLSPSSPGVGAFFVCASYLLNSPSVSAGYARIVKQTTLLKSLPLQRGLRLASQQHNIDTV
jgi:hypothetical protein